MLNRTFQSFQETVSIKKLHKDYDYLQGLRLFTINMKIWIVVVLNVSNLINFDIYASLKHYYNQDSKYIHHHSKSFLIICFNGFQNGRSSGRQETVFLHPITVQRTLLSSFSMLSPPAKDHQEHFQSKKLILLSLQQGRLYTMQKQWRVSERGNG